MEREQPGSGALASVAELFDLPADIVARLPHLELIGDRQLFVERHTGLLSYQEDRIDINTPAGVLSVRGAGLNLLVMTAEEMRLHGRIDSIQWVR